MAAHLRRNTGKPTQCALAGLKAFPSPSLLSTFKISQSWFSTVIPNCQPWVQKWKSQSKETSPVFFSLSEHGTESFVPPTSSWKHRNHFTGISLFFFQEYFCKPNNLALFYSCSSSEKQNHLIKYFLFCKPLKSTLN